MGKTVTIIDYKVANIYNISKAFEYLGAQVHVTADPVAVEACTALVLPGVGAYESGVEGLLRYRLMEPIRHVAEKGVPILGICLGAQLLMDEGHEFGTFQGLGLIPGTVDPFPSTLANVKVPHIGWNAVEEGRAGAWQGTILEALPQKAAMYFNHSYYLNPSDKSDILGTTTYGAYTYPAAICKKNVIGTQFHPEKSADQGLALLKAFINSI